MAEKYDFKTNLMLNAYYAFDGDYIEASKAIKINWKRIISCWNNFSLINKEDYRGHTSGLDFLNNNSRYTGLSRRELLAVDSSLYHRLLKEGNLGVIPELTRGRHTLDHQVILETKEKIFGLLRENHTCPEIAEILGVSKQTIYRYLKLNPQVAEVPSQ